MRVRMVQANGLEFGLLEAGTGPLALCLHGFPDSAHTWRHLLPALAEVGFHASRRSCAATPRPRSLPTAAMGSTPWPATP